MYLSFNNQDRIGKGAEEPNTNWDGKTASESSRWDQAVDNEPPEVAKILVSLLRNDGCRCNIAALRISSRFSVL